MQIELTVLECKRCGHKWVPRHVIIPKVCSKCTSRFWNQEKQPRPGPRPIIDRLMDLIKQDLETGCWLWQGGTDKDGYGLITATRDGKKRTYRIPRLVYEMFVGPIPHELLVLHKCDTPPCCNPDHLFTGTQKINREDCKAKKRTAVGERNGGGMKLVDAQVISIYHDPREYKVIANEYKVSTYTVERIKCKKNWSHVTESFPDMRIGHRPNYARAKLKASDIHVIRKDPRTCKDIAKDYGVTLSTISRIKNGTTYGHVIS